MARDTDIPIAFLHECFILRDDGALIWRTRPREHFATPREWSRWNTRYAGKEAGCLADRYVTVRLSGRLVFGHRIVWAMTTGAWPADQIDHRDGCDYNNKFTNLREATRLEQMQNYKTRVDSTSGVLGISPHLSKWRARIQVRGRRIHLGVFDTREGAAAAYLDAKKLYHHFQPEPRARA